MENPQPDHEFFAGWAPRSLKRFWDYIELTDDGHWLWRGPTVGGWDTPNFSAMIDGKPKSVSVVGFLWRMHFGEFPKDKRARRNCVISTCTAPNCMRLYDWKAPQQSAKVGRKPIPTKPELPDKCGNGHDLIGPRRASWTFNRSKQRWRWNCSICQRAYNKEYRERNPQGKPLQVDWQSKAEDYLNSL